MPGETLYLVSSGVQGPLVLGCWYSDPPMRADRKADLERLAKRMLWRCVWGTSDGPPTPMEVQERMRELEHVVARYGLRVFKRTLARGGA